ncbi:DnaJ-like protein DjlA [hydrothermal vent metagenome]|uniref:DnaJ-like protein DjlA n=1 Tax=hydrothermal vent metagenome TaxID=652676 RepID=A0A3B0R3D5_9ZZZZ
MGMWRKLIEIATRAADLLVEREADSLPPDRRIDDAGFAAALIALSAKMAKADGLVTSDEVAAFRQIFSVPPEAERDVARLFNMFRETTLGYQSYAKQVARKFRCCPFVLEDVLDGLFHIAKADGVVTAEEEKFLQTVADIFGFSRLEYRRIRASRLGREPDDPYLILGVEETISNIDLKTAYRRMASINHPDRVLARGLPSELQNLANAKMAMINLAYSRILQERAMDDKLVH